MQQISKGDCQNNVILCNISNRENGATMGFTFFLDISVILNKVSFLGLRSPVLPLGGLLIRHYKRLTNQPW